MQYVRLCTHNHLFRLSAPYFQLKIVRVQFYFYIDNGVAVSSLDVELKTPLHWAALFGHVCVIEYLISVGASVNATQIDGFTSLHCSAALDQDNACKTLLQFYFY
jgi:ankyrin repeat protein